MNSHGEMHRAWPDQQRTRAGAAIFMHQPQIPVIRHPFSFVNAEHAIFVEKSFTRIDYFSVADVNN
jgi:hypothetical protein